MQRQSVWERFDFLFKPIVYSCEQLEKHTHTHKQNIFWPIAAGLLMTRSTPDATNQHNPNRSRNNYKELV